MLFANLTSHEAANYKDHVVARERPRLSDLAYWMAEDGGPVEQMDGSQSSLVALWTWYRDFWSRGCPGVVLSTRPSIYAVAGPGAALHDDMRADYVQEGIEHYFARVVFNLDAGARWSVYEWKTRGAIDVNHHATGVTTSTKHFISPFGAVNHLHYQMVDGRELPDPNGALKRKLDGYEGWPTRALEQRSLAQVLSPFLEQPRVPADDPARIVPTLTLTPAGPPIAKPDRAGGSVMLVRGPGGDLDKPIARLKPLPGDKVAAVLTALRFLADGDVSPTGTTLLVDGATLEHAEGWAVVQVEVARGTLRALTIKALDASHDEWKQLLLPLREFAASIDATLG